MAAPTGKLAFAYRTIAALEQQLADVRAQQSRQGGEAVAWRVTGRGGITVTAQYPEWAEADCLLTIDPLYTHPPTTPTDSRVVPVELLRLIEQSWRVPNGWPKSVPESVELRICQGLPNSAHCWR